MASTVDKTVLVSVHSGVRTLPENGGARSTGGAHTTGGAQKAGGESAHAPSVAPVMEPAAPIERAASKDILIVDDAPANLHLLSRMLMAQGYHVRLAASGDDALAAVRAALPDMILLDVHMPKMNGYQICERLKGDERTRHVPVIFISALDQTEDKAKAFTAGGVDYVTKPIQIEEVLARLHTHLSLRDLQAELSHADAELAACRAEQARTNADLQAAQAEIKTLCSLLPVCATCQDMRDERSYWRQVQAYVKEHAQALKPYTMCEQCAEERAPGS
jgi:CheY-like chemotaxis protein